MQYWQSYAQALDISTFSREMQRPSPAKLWQIPQAAALPICPFCAFLSTPLEVQATSYFAASVNIFNFSNRSIASPPKRPIVL